MKPSSRSWLFLVALLAVFPLLVGTSAVARERPAIVLVPGAFHPALVYEKVVQLLHEAQYRRTFAIDLPSVGNIASRDHDVRVVRSTLVKELEAGRDVILVGNSYGATVISEAVKDQKGDQAQPSNIDYQPSIRRQVWPPPPPSRGKVLGLVYIAGYLPYISDVVHPETKPDIRNATAAWFRFTDDKVFWDGDPKFPPAVTFYNDLSSSDAAYWSTKLRFSSFVALNASATYIPYTGDFKCTYVIGKKDISITPELAKTYLQQTGAKFEVEWLDADHVPMLSRPKDVVHLIRKAAGEKY